MDHLQLNPEDCINTRGEILFWKTNSKNEEARPTTLPYDTYSKNPSGGKTPISLLTGLTWIAVLLG
jgi:hypothetical protein